MIDPTQPDPIPFDDDSWSIGNLSDGQLWGCMALIPIGAFVVGFIVGAIAL